MLGTNYFQVNRSISVSTKTDRRAMISLNSAHAWRATLERCAKQYYTIIIASGFLLLSDGVCKNITPIVRAQKVKKVPWPRPQTNPHICMQCRSSACCFVSEWNVTASRHATHYAVAHHLGIAYYLNIRTHLLILVN